MNRRSLFAGCAGLFPTLVSQHSRAQPLVTTAEGNWYLPRWAVDSLQQATLEQTVELAKRADTIDLVLRIDGQEVRLQADWVKHLAKTAAQSP